MKKFYLSLLLTLSFYAVAHNGTQCNDCRSQENCNTTDECPICGKTDCNEKHTDSIDPYDDEDDSEE